MNQILTPMTLKKQVTFLSLLLLSLLFLSYRGSAQQNTRSFDGTDQYVKNYLEHLPDDYNANDPTRYPVIIALHGFGEGGDNSPGSTNNLLRTGLPAIINAGNFPSSFNVNGKVYKFIVISPQLNQQNLLWYTPQVAYVMNQIKSIYKNKADFQRIYLTGYSGGGAGVYTYPASSPDNGNQLAAAVVCTGASWYYGNQAVENIVSSSLPIWAFHNDGDPVVNLSSDQSWFNALNSSGMNPTMKLTIYPGVNQHDCWSRTYDPSGSNPNNIYAWMLQYSRPNISNPGGGPPDPQASIPASNAGGNQTLTLPENSVTLDGSGSTDNGGHLRGFQWAKVSGPGGDNLDKFDHAKAKVNFVNSGTYIYSLTVTDDQGYSSTSQTSVQVNPAPVAASVANANAGNNQTITFPTNSVTLDGSASTDAGGNLSTYQWVKVSGPTGDNIQNAGQARTTTSFINAGNYVYSLTVTDYQGHASSAQTSIQVNPAPAPQTNSVITANAGPGQTITLPVYSVTLNGLGSTDQGATINQYQWVKVSGPDGGDYLYNAGLVQAGVNFKSAGTFVYKLTVTDDQGNSSNAQTTIQVNGPVTTPLPPAVVPIANAGPDQTVQLPNNLVSLDGSRSSTAGVIGLAYNWTEVSGPTGAGINSSSDISPSISNLIAGTYIFSLALSNSNGDVSNSTTRVTVVNSPPAQATLALYPNPASSQTTLQVNTPSTGLMYLQLYDLNGNLLNQLNIQKQFANFSQSFDVTGLMSGNYLLKVSVGGFTQSVMVQKK